MTTLKSRFQKWTAVLGTIFLLLYLFQDILYRKMWILPFLMMMLFAIAFLVVFTVGLFKKDKGVIPIFVATILVIVITEVLISETFKSEKVLYATLDDDRAAINLTLRKNSKFEVNVVTMFGEETFKGQYKILNDKIIFLDKPYNNDYIPDTVMIVANKIILRVDKDNEPITDFATYFDISLNRIKNSP